MLSGQHFGWVRRVFVTASVGVVIAALLSPSAAGQTTSQCPDAVPTSELSDLSSGTGWTVADGQTREQFTWTYMGTLQDALGPGRDVIIVDTAGPVIDRYGGIFYGMSGSPLYQGERLVGAIAYGLSYGPSSVAGVTPAEDMLRILDYPRAEEDDTTTPERTAPMPFRMRAKIAASNSMATSEVSSSFRRLHVPVGISGVGAQDIERIRKVVEREGLSVIPHAASSQVSSNQTTTATPEPGSNVSAVLSYGDITFAGTGTLTVACDGKFIAFGHPFFWEGETTFGGNGADTIAVIEDSLFGSYELANVTDQFAMIDQDRLAGLRGFLGESTETVPITSTVDSPDTGVSRDGLTTVVEQEAVGFLAFYHLYSNILVTIDEYGDGSSSGTFTINGVTEDGTTWDISRTNMYSSRYGIADESSYELESYLYSLYNNPFEDVEFTSIDADFTARSEPLDYEIDEVLVSNTGRNYEDRRRIRATPGSTIYLRVMLLPEEDEDPIPVNLTVRVPRRARGEKTISIASPRYYEDRICLYRPKRCTTATGDKVDSLEEMIEVLEAHPSNNVLRAQMGRGDKAPRDEEILDRVVFGRARVTVRIGCCSGGSGETVGSDYRQT